jgi:hypothetical protein
MERDIRKAHDIICQDIMQMIVDAMSEKKIDTFCNACNRNGYLTSHFGMSTYHLDTYIEGWYFRCEGTRSSFAVWAWNRDGDLEIGRKPKENKLRFIWSHTFADMPIALRKKYYTI